MAVDADAPTSGLHAVPATMDLPQNGSEQDPGRRLEIVVSAAAQVHGGFRRGRCHWVGYSGDLATRDEKPPLMGCRCWCNGTGTPNGARPRGVMTRLVTRS
jgi:hypothetical protein